MAALECGLTWERAASMKFTQVVMAVRARNDNHRTGDEKQSRTKDGRSVRDATAADIRAFLG